MKLFNILFLSFISVLEIYSSSFANIKPDSVYNSHIKTILLFKNEDELSDPVINLKGNDYLTLLFDDLSGKIETYNYDFIHCNEDWTPTNLSQTEYLDGFSSNVIEKYAFSFNTFFNYIHYKVSFPNENISFRLSGNYLVVVYKDMNRDSIAFSKKFYLVDKRTDVNVSVRRPLQSKYYNEGQDVSFKIITGNYRINNPMEEIKVVVMQNNRTDNLLRGLKPLFISPTELSYDYQDKNIFDGGSEFRYFNIKSMRYQGEFIKSITYKKPYYYVELVYDEPNTFKSYFFNYDINGKYKIDYQESENDHTDADYVFVTFTLKMDAPIIDGDIYIIGALTNWQLNKNSRMEYDFDKKAYQTTLLLKQGYYNYQYGYLIKGMKKADLSLIEGNHYQTGNDYSVFVYQRRPGSRYDELIGYIKTSSIF